eukprot:CAMPEP_0206270906 /NCGR_PEP_ID=MMETSP0047_2-20121206/33125_1 /ASSEMBLY_ACC=CAM_ASM_000192 /TAXON_ID=195065 /ORGANISM="Chroomonas mesostigmatica_cf, Strain CCMP1168" /LENGTH=78 /DNA_ID=CAMNT_0053699593 /DNA_START=1049 /DNA_END=1282 /DNA_ORIENTATION=-
MTTRGSASMSAARAVAGGGGLFVPPLAEEGGELMCRIPTRSARKGVEEVKPELVAALPKLDSHGPTTAYSSHSSPGPK